MQNSRDIALASKFCRYEDARNTAWHCNNDDPDWTYGVTLVPGTTEQWVIAVYDDGSVFLGYL